MRSIWETDVKAPPRPTLDSAVSCDVVVIGGGIAGILTAYHLQEKGVSTIVLEANRVGSGQTAGTSAKITSQHGLCYARLEKHYGREGAAKYAAAQERAIERYRELVRQHGIACDFEELPAYLYTMEAPGVLEKEGRAAERAGIDATLTSDTELPFRPTLALRYTHQAQFHPLRFLFALADGLTVYEHTKALAVERNLVRTENGTVSAKAIVFCTHFPFVDNPGFYFTKMHQARSCFIAYEGVEPLRGMYRGIDAGAHSFRPFRNMTLLGGGNYRTGENEQGGTYHALRRTAESYWQDPREVCCWSAQDCMTADALPFIGPYSKRRPAWYVVTGFGKWGMTNAMVAADIISESVMGQRPDYADIFDPGRLKISAAFRRIGKDLCYTTGSLAKTAFYLPAKRAEELAPGEAGIVRYKGKRAACYRDPAGKLHPVKSPCAHLGCSLRWNRDETVWECPCHGSRYDMDGKLLNNPANKGIEWNSGKK
ncbi:MAG: FAD-dependent oxidoreductase [Eubacteriales bacterium]